MKDYAKYFLFGKGTEKARGIKIWKGSSLMSTYCAIFKLIDLLKIFGIGKFFFKKMFFKLV